MSTDLDLLILSEKQDWFRVGNDGGGHVDSNKLKRLNKGRIFFKKNFLPTPRGGSEYGKI